MLVKRYFGTVQVPTEEPRGLQFAIQEKDTSSVSRMNDAHCSKEYAASEMTKLDE